MEITVIPTVVPQHLPLLILTAILFKDKEVVVDSITTAVAVALVVVAAVEVSVVAVVVAAIPEADSQITYLIFLKI